MRWNIKNKNIGNIENIFGLLLENRNIDKNFIKKYTFEDLSDPYEIFDMDKCVQRIDDAIRRKDRIYIHGDFDVDGTAATSILWSYLYRVKGADVKPYIPHRVDEGYGLSKPTIDKLINDNAKLIITVDCGIKDIELCEYAKSKGVEIIISDHHEFVRNSEGEPILPDTTVIHGMNPQAKTKRIFCGGVTAWKIVCAMEKMYTGEGYTQTSRGYIDLAAITTLTDVMPLKDENRIIVSLGLQMMREKRRVGIDELCKVSGIIPENLDSYHIGFMLGPRLNAPGRVENSAINSLRLLCTENRIKAQELSKHLDELNKKRQGLTEKYMSEVEKQISFDERNNVKTKIVFAHGEDWPEGIVGLVAGKITEKYNRPTFVMSYNSHEKKVIGSSRSIKNFNLVKALDECKPFLTRYGGHYMAAGFSLAEDNISLFKEALEKVADNILDEELLIPEINIDCFVAYDALNLEIFEKLKELSPFGYGNTTPIFAYENAILVSSKTLGNSNQHLKQTWNLNSKLIDSISFNSNEEWKDLKEFTSHSIAFTLDVNEWNGKKNLQLILKDIH